MEFLIKIDGEHFSSVSSEGRLLVSGPAFNQIGDEIFQFSVETTTRTFEDADITTVASLALSRKEATQLAAMLTSGLKNSRGDE